MRKFLIILLLFIMGCSHSSREYPYPLDFDKPNPDSTVFTDPPIGVDWPIPEHYDLDTNTSYFEYIEEPNGIILEIDETDFSHLYILPSNDYWDKFPRTINPLRNNLNLKF